MTRFSRYAQIPKVAGRPSRRKGLAAVWTIAGVGKNARLIAEIPTPGVTGGMDRLDLSRWLPLKELFRPFADAFVRWAIDKAPSSRTTFLALFNEGWISFFKTLPDYDTRQLGEIDSRLVRSFIVWLNEQDGAKGPRWQSGTKTRMLGKLRAMLDSLNCISEWASQLDRELSIPKTPWVDTQSDPTWVLSTPEWEALYLACIKEAGETKRNVESDWRLMKDFRGDRPCASHHRNKNPYGEIDRCLARLDKLYPSVIPAHDQIHRDDLRLGVAVGVSHRWRRVIRSFHPTPRLLVPFVVLLAIYFEANRDALLGADRGDFERQVVLGQSRIKWRKFKGRAGRMRRTTFPENDDVDNPSAILKFLDRWTARIRCDVPASIGDRVFLYAALGRATTFLPDRRPKCVITWTWNLDAFCKDHRLPKMNARILRASNLEQVAQMFDDDVLAVKARGGQSRDETIHRHYTSKFAHARSQERVGSVLELRHRWVTTGGKIDPRKRPPKADRGAATPGWSCLDPFQSPVPGQSQGQLCRAYGTCPVCPLAQTDVSSSYALARILQLRAAIKEAQVRTPARRWLAQWAPVLHALQHRWLPRFRSRIVLNEARKLQLGPLPPLE